MGRTISRYKILEKLGEGGMGVVYKAEDTKLDRLVALKFLPAHLLGNDEVRKRFEREAKAAASLDHPNVCTVYEIDEVNGKTFIAMAYVAGESLDKKIERGPLKLEEALDIARQIPKGLEAAHKRGIFHRDIKPENVMVGEDGRVTIMDFGLAQLVAASRLTKTDQTMGTTEYMSPEQTEGSGTDHRTDIWSLGVVLYEMVTGQKPFKGDYDQAVTYSILNEPEEPVTALRTGVPMELEVLVGKCMAKDQANRYQTAGELIVDLRRLADKTKPERSRTALDTPILHGHRQPVWKAALPWALFTLAALSLAGVTFNWLGEVEPPRSLPYRTYSIPVSPPPTRPVISPDGRRIAYVSQQSVWVLDLDRRDLQGPRRLEGTQGITNRVFWAPNGDWLGFTTGTSLMKIRPAGGSALKIADKKDPRLSQGAWLYCSDKIILSGLGAEVLFEVKASGGSLDPVRKSNGLTSPAAIPSQSSLVLAKERATIFENAPLVAFDLDSGNRLVVGQGRRAVASPEGHLLLEVGASALDSEIWAMAFSFDALQATGEKFLVSRNASDASVSNDGTLVYREGYGTRREPVWLNRRGVRVGKPGSPISSGSTPAVSPAQDQLALSGIENGNNDIWVQSLESGVTARLTFQSGRDWRPVFTSDVKYVAYAAMLEPGDADILWKPANRSGEVETLVAMAELDYPNDWSPDGRHLIFQTLNREGGAGFDLWVLSRDDEGGFGEPTEFLATEFAEREARISPDGRYVAYVSDETGSYEVWVRPFPQGPGRWQVTENGGGQPLWSRDGEELFFVEEGLLVAVPVRTGQEFSWGPAEPLFSHESFGVMTNPRQTYGVSADGEKFLVLEQSAETTQTALRIVENWYQEFSDREQN